jgi:hypothetical protein
MAFTTLLPFRGFLSTLETHLSQPLIGTSGQRALQGQIMGRNSRFRLCRFQLCRFRLCHF